MLIGGPPGIQKNASGSSGSKKGSVVSPNKAGGLTTDKLHPERYLTEKPEFPQHQLVDSTIKTMENIRERNQYK